MTKDELIKLKEELLKLEDKRKFKELLPARSCYQELIKTSKNHMNDVAIHYLGTVITFKQLHNKIDNMAKALTDIGVKKGDVVSVSMLATPEGIISFFALNKIGAVANMINAFSAGENEIIDQMKKVNSKILITHDIFYNSKVKKAMDKLNAEHIILSNLTDSLPNVLNMDRAKFTIVNALKSFGNYSKKDDKCISFNTFMENGSKSETLVNSVYEPYKMAMIAYTSGSTGEAKAVVGTNEAAIAMPYLMGMTVENFAPKDIMFSTLPLWIYYELINSIIDPLLLGASVALDPLFDAKKFDKRVSQYHFNHWNTIAPDVIEMTKNKRMNNYDLSFLKSVSVGGAPIDADNYKKGIEFFRARNSEVDIWDGYGTSETLGCIMLDHKPLIGNVLKLINPITGNIVTKENEEGELYVLTPTLMQGYNLREDMTEETLSRDDENYVWFKTGDLFKIHDINGILKYCYVGRMRRMEISKDQNGVPCKIIPDEINRVIKELEEVSDCETIVITDKKYLTRAAVYVVLEENINNKDIKNKILKYCSSNLPEYMVPVDIIFIKNMPRLSSGKNDLVNLSQHYENNKKKVLKK